MGDPTHPLSRRRLLGAGMMAAAGCGAVDPMVRGGEPGTDSPSGTIDAHVHVWTADTERYPLAPGYCNP